jgi:hypothetical protein
MINEDNIQEKLKLQGKIIEVFQRKSNMNIIQQSKREDKSVLTEQAKGLVLVAGEIADMILDYYFGIKV